MRLPRRETPITSRPPRVGERRVDGAEHERAGQAHALEPGPADARVERFDVDGDVGQLGHRGRMLCPIELPARCVQRFARALAAGIPIDLSRPVILSSLAAFSPMIFALSASFRNAAPPTKPRGSYQPMS